VAGPAGGAGEHRVGTIEAAALQPDRRTATLDAAQQVEAAVLEAFAGGSPAEAQDVPADKAAVGRQPDAGLHARPGTVEDDGFLGQPFQRGALLHRQLEALRRLRPAAAVPLAGPRRGELGVGAGAHGGGDQQVVAPAMPDGGCSTMAWQTPSPSG
jgi:hypothetical protein